LQGISGDKVNFPSQPADFETSLKSFDLPVNESLVSLLGD